MSVLTIEARMYQLFIVSRVLKAKADNKNVIVELDAGMGKRVISSILAKYMEPSEKMIFITPSRASVMDTYNFFKSLENERVIKGLRIGTLSSNLSSAFKLSILKKNNVVITTPITLANVLSKYPEKINFDYVLINEIDKTVRRSSTIPIYDNVIDYLASFQLVYPWPKLRYLLPKDACWIGLSGTLRDFHTVKIEKTIVFKKELETIAKLLFPRDKEIDYIFMDKLIDKTDALKYVYKNLTIVKTIPVKDNLVKQILDAITGAIGDVTKILASKYSFDSSTYSLEEKVERAISRIPNDDLYKIRFLRLALVRKFITASVPSHYSHYIKRPSISRLIREKMPNFSNKTLLIESSKVKKIVEMASEWVHTGRKVAILVSYIVTAREIKEKLESKGIKVYLLTGKTVSKARVLNEFKEYDGGAVLVLTPVGERDLDLPHTDLLIVHDVINTVKSMYQRFKRGRRAYVAVLYYDDTFEEYKVRRLLDRIKERYPWSIVID